MIETPDEVARARFSWDASVSLTEKILAVYGDQCHPTYLDEKARLVAEIGLTAWFWTLDREHQRRLVEAATGWYQAKREAARPLHV